MCDYSLMMLRNRLAAEGEELVAHRFQSGTIGMVSGSDFGLWQSQQRSKGFWQSVKAWFTSEAEPAPVVCIPPGAQLRVLDIPQGLQEQYCLGSCENAVFAELSPEANRYRDAMRFGNGATILLQLLREGQRVKVLRFSSEESVELVPEPVLAKRVA